MTPEVVVQVVGRLYAGAGRRHDEITLQAWHEALRQETDNDAIESAVEYLRELGPSEAPNIATYIATMRRRARRRTLEQPALPAPAARETPRPEAQANIDRLRKQLRSTPIKRVDDALRRAR